MKLPKFASAFLGVVLLFTALVWFLGAKASIRLEEIHQLPSLRHPFGTDDLGRDLFILSFRGLHTSLFVGLLAALFDILIGVPYGAFAGYKGGSFETCFMRVADILYIIPLILQILLFINLFGAGLLPIIAAFFLSSWVPMARVVCHQVRVLKKKPFFLYASMMGASYFHIFFTHISKNIGPFVFPVVAYTIPRAIFIEAFLSFLGLGISPPRNSIGTLIAEGTASMEFFPWRLFFPAALLLGVLFSFQQLTQFTSQQKEV